MTEQEAKYAIIEYKPIIGFKRYVEALDTAIKALEEIQQYRALGMTPELIEAMQGHNIAMINDLAEYQALGTVEELTEAMNLYVAINKVEDDICRLGVGCDDLRERIKQIYKQFRGKV